MSTCRFAASLLLVGLVVSFLNAAEVRTWTNNKGQTLTGSLVEVTDDGHVKIDCDGKVYTLAVDVFTDVDQEYIKNHKDDDASSSSPRTRRKSDLTSFRTWTSSTGMEIRAKFVRIHEGKIILLQGRKSHHVTFYELSEEDQKYLKEEMDARGESDLLATTMVQTNGGGASGPGGESNPIASGGGMSPPGMMGNQGPPSIYAPPKTDDFAKMQQEMHEKNRQEIARVEAENRRRAEEAQRQQQEQARQQQEAETRRQQERERAAQEQVARQEQRMQEMMRGPELVEYKYCTNCNATLPDNVGAGDNCPSCGVYFAGEQDRFGNTTKTASSSSSFSGGRFRFRPGVLVSIIGGLFGCLVGAARWLMKSDN